eukprot:3798050-Alexandrium_andersonii.AAC.1
MCSQAAELQAGEGQGQASEGVFWTALRRRWLQAHRSSLGQLARWQLAPDLGDGSAAMGVHGRAQGREAAAGALLGRHTSWQPAPDPQGKT